MSNSRTKKICIVVMSLSAGGVERSSAMLSELLYDIGYEVHIVSVLNKIEYAYKGDLLNLGELKAKDDSIFGRLKRLKALKNYLDEQDFDYIIDNRTRIGFIKEFIISKWLYKAEKTIYNVHSFHTDNYIHPKLSLGKLLYASAHKIVTVSNAILDKLNQNYGFKNLTVIHNLAEVNFFLDNSTPIKGDFILYYGRLNDNIKNISLLIEAYSKSKLSEIGINLKILGKGKDRDTLVNIVDKLQLENHIEFLDFRINPYDIVNQAHFTVLTSRYEGFPMILIESLALGTPVVSVDCKSGPSEIIINEHNGLLVENHNPIALANAMDRMVEDKDLYLHCKSNAKSSVAKFSKETIGLQWQAILR